MFTFGKNLQKAYDWIHLKKTPCSGAKKKKKSNAPCCRTKKESSIQRFCLHTTLSPIKWFKNREFCSFQFIHTVVSDSLWPHGLQNTRLPGPSPTPRVYSNSCPLSQWCHPTISSSVVPFSFLFQSFPALGLFQWVSSLHQLGKLLEFQLQHQPFQWIFRTDFL